MNDSTKHVTDSIPAWLAGELDSAEGAAVECHLETCLECARAANENRAIWDALGSAAPRESELSSPSVWPQVRARTLARRGEQSWFYGANALVRSGLAVGAVAAGLFVAVILPGQSHNGVSDLAADASGLTVETAWLEDSSWTAGDQDNELDRLWIIAGLD
jgi:anti-sigma factor RsiW